LPGGIGTSPATAAGIPGLNLDNFYTSGMPNFSIYEPGDADQGVNGRTQLGYALNNNRCNCPLKELERQYQFIDNVSKIHGNHTFKFGADLRYAENPRIPSDNHRAGELQFNDGLMYVFGVGNVSSHGIQNMNWHEFAPRVGFAYQVTPKTVVRAGYGWSYNLSTFGSTFGHNVTQNPPVLTNQNIPQANNFS